MNERGCYCDLWRTAPDVLQQQGVPPGYCGICDRCGQPGHTRHAHPPAPVTGAWCDRCYRITGYTRHLRNPFAWAGLIGVGWAVASHWLK